MEVIFLSYIYKKIIAKGIKVLEIKLSILKNKHWKNELINLIYLRRL